MAVVTKRFKIGETTLYEWQKRREETGDFIAFLIIVETIKEKQNQQPSGRI